MFTITNNSGHLIASAAQLLILREFLMRHVDDEILSAEITETELIATTQDGKRCFDLSEERPVKPESIYWEPWK